MPRLRLRVGLNNVDLAQLPVFGAYAPMVVEQASSLPPAIRQEQNYIWNFSRLGPYASGGMLAYRGVSTVSLQDTFGLDSGNNNNPTLCWWRLLACGPYGCIWIGGVILLSFSSCFSPAAVVAQCENATHVWSEAVRRLSSIHGERRR